MVVDNVPFLEHKCFFGFYGNQNNFYIWNVFSIFGTLCFTNGSRSFERVWVIFLFWALQLVLEPVTLLNSSSAGRVVFKVRVKLCILKSVDFDLD